MQFKDNFTINKNKLEINMCTRETCITIDRITIKEIYIQSDMYKILSKSMIKLVLLNW